MKNTEQLHPNAAQLLAYVDGTLNSQQIQEVELLLEKDSSAGEFVQTLEITALPFKQAFEPLLTSIEDVSIAMPPTTPPPAYWQTTFLSTPIKLVAGLLLGISISLTYHHLTTEDRSDWMVQVAEYQQLYVRDTLHGTTPLTAPQITALQLRFNEALGTQITIPDLSAQQLRFMRGQILSVNGKPLIQLVYMPLQGKPVALCITPNSDTSTNLIAGEARGLKLVHWRTEANSFVLIGDHAIQRLMQQAEAARAQIS